MCLCCCFRNKTRVAIQEQPALRPPLPEPRSEAGERERTQRMAAERRIRPYTEDIGSSSSTSSIVASYQGFSKTSKFGDFGLSPEELTMLQKRQAKEVGSGSSSSSVDSASGVSGTKFSKAYPENLELSLNAIDRMRKILHNGESSESSTQS